MRESIQECVKIYVSKHRSRKVFRKAVRVMGCVVAFVTTYALILPAITLEKATFCGVDEHIHTALCYQQQTEDRELICSIGSDTHAHSADCYHANGSVICGQADYIIHSHDSSCRNYEGELICTLPERSQHFHGTACYITPEPQFHAHTDACMVDVKGDLICIQQENQGHKHSEPCYRVTSELLCTKVEAHQHGDICYVSQLDCTLSAEPHFHSAGCYGTGSLICNIPENHTHQENCMESVLACGNMDVEHQHTDACYDSKIICNIEAGHIHGSACYESVINCGKADGEAHHHTDSCYSSQQLLTCTQEENHIHSSSCYCQELSCEIPESDGHIHGDVCYQWNREYGCGMEDGQPEPVEPELVCTEPEASAHVHGENCFQIHQQQAEAICGEVHEHTYTCYQKLCILEEHTHSLQCYSDPTADVETRQFWESTMKNVVLTGDWNLDVVAIAESQLGYEESTRNYTVWEDGSMHGYTRYGDWYTVPHGDWCGMFASFCLRYAGMDTIPINYGVRPWIQDLSKPELDLYRTAEEYTPIPGDIVFFDWDRDELSDHVGIVYEVIEATEFTKAKLKTIEGNSSNRVQFVTYDLDSPNLLGYSMLPENPDVVYTCGFEKHIHNMRDCFNELDALICDAPQHIHSCDCIQELPEAPTEPAEPTYYCGLETHDHTDVCYDSDGNPICQMIWHQHEDSCLVEPVPEPVYYCGLEIHTHEDSCFDKAGELICVQTEHTHGEDCLVEPALEPVYYCGLEIHTHEDSCFDGAGELTCQQTEHEHADVCLTEPQYYCGMEVHVHDEVACYDADGNLFCETPEHEHVERCTWVPMMAPSEATYYCGQEEHTHGQTCYDANKEIVCPLQEHSHTEDCLIQPLEYLCGIKEHIHTDACRDSAGGLICDAKEHKHTSVCLTDLCDLDADARERVETVIRLIDDIPSADELMAKSEELAEAGDMEAEEQWMTENYQKIGLAYSQYVGLPENLQNRVVNRDKLLELEFVWSRMPLATYYVWLDGTNGGMMSHYGSDNTLQTLITSQSTYQYKLPTTWKSPSKYSYTLRGWYDIYSKTYYNPGDTVNITRNTVFYADWEASNYNIGQFNRNVVDTVSTNEFVTTRMFDYSGIFNMYSSSMHSNHVRQDSHAESWNALAKGSGSLGIILRDWDTNGPKQNSWPSNYDNSGNPQFNTSDYVTSGLYYSYNMYDLFFNPNTHYMGKEYLGTADHLFQYEKNPDSPYYGYYYYDSARNAASYNQSTGRFYVYDYLERTTTSKDNNKDSDFLPFNSPYVNNPQGHSPVSETSSTGQRIYTFSSSDGNSGMTGANFWFGMTTDIRFYLPNVPGISDNNGGYGNQSIYGQDMEFRFSGDDDVYVLVDNSLVLDIGGIHDIKSGTINFSTGRVTVEGTEQTDKSAIVRSLAPGEHTLTLLYMERGSSMSNCSIYFNISPRFTLSIQKEDLLSNELMNGAEFQVFMDENCTQPATLWSSYQDYRDQKSNTTNTISVRNGKSSIWGFAAGNTYYIKETKPPDEQGYLVPNGLIKMELSNKGIASYTAIVISDPQKQTGENNPSPGFKVEGFRIDEENHVAYLIINNSIPEGETNQVLVRKVWESAETKPVTVYLLADGKRIQSTILSSENCWQYAWDNLPKYKTVLAEDGVTTQKVEIQYTVEESTVPGFVGKVEAITENVSTTAFFEVASGFTVNETYLLQTSSGYLATTANGGLQWVSEEIAKSSNAAHWWVESYSGEQIYLKNEAGYYLRSHWIGYQDGECYFYGDTQRGYVKYINSRFREAGDQTRYLYTELDANGYSYGYYNDYDAAQFTLYRRIAEENSEPIEGLGFKITNRPVSAENQTSLTVTKSWTERDGVTPFANQSLYETASVSVKLQARSEGSSQYVDTGQTAVLSLRSQWKHTFAGLPVKDSSGATIEYTVVEDWDNDDWKPQYSTVVKQQDGTYSVGINNVYDHRIEIPVEKYWDSTIHHADKETVQIRLYAAPDDYMEGTLVDSILLTAETDWKGVLKAIPPDVENVNYYIHEPTELFAPEYGVPARIFINGTSQRVSRVVFDSVTGDAETAVITNRPLLELPETGGAGTIPYTAGGMLTISAAMRMLYKKRSKRRKGAVKPTDA